MRLFLLIIVLGILQVAATRVSAQTEPGKPANAQPGKCYGRVYIPNEYDYVEVTEIDRPSYVKKINIPARYETRFDTIVIREAAKKLEVMPAVYETVIETVVIAPPSTKWVKMSSDPTCLSKNPADCQVLALVEVPAQYNTFKRTVLKTPSFTREINISKEIKIVPRQVLVEAARVEDITIPPTYKTVMKRVVKKQGGYSDWVEVLCTKDITPKIVLQVQKALNEKGFTVGVVDGYLGPSTDEALIKFQEANRLPSGNLNLPTLKALGISL